MVDPDEIKSFEKIFEEISRQWKLFQPIHWEQQPGNPEDISLIKVAGSHVEQSEGVTLSTMQSMRSVDAGCVVELTYQQLMENKDAQQT